jgi:lipoprotein NlpI
MKEINMQNENGNGFDLPDIIDFNQIIERDPNYAKAYVNRGLTHSNNGHDDLAIADLTEALRLDPDNIFARRILNEINERVEQTKKEDEHAE